MHVIIPWYRESPEVSGKGEERQVLHSKVKNDGRYAPGASRETNAPLIERHGDARVRIDIYLVTHAETAQHSPRNPADFVASRWLSVNENSYFRDRASLDSITDRGCSSV